MNLLLLLFNKKGRFPIFHSENDLLFVKHLLITLYLLLLISQSEQTPTARLVLTHKTPLVVPSIRHTFRLR